MPQRDDEGAVEFVLKRYTDNRDDAQRIVLAARSISSEFAAVADTLERFLDDFKWEA